MNKLAGILKGKKTYVTAAIGIATAVGSYLVGDLSAVQALQIVWNGLLAIFIRNGVASLPQ